MSARAYLDWNATAPLRTEARAAMAAAMDVVGNPSSVHAEGRAARALVERARAQVAAAFGADAGDIIFTSGATEAAAMVLGGGWERVLASPVEHDCIDAWRDRFAGWVDLDVDADGIVHPPALAGHAPAAGDLCVVQAANGETGITQPLLASASAVDLAGASALVDAVQYAGKLPLAINWGPPQFTLLSAHKLGGPKGIGALVMPKGAELPALMRGGGQETGQRSGTQNVIGIAGFGAAAQAAARDLADGVWEAVAVRRDTMEADLLDAVADAKIVGAGVPRLPNTTCVMVPGWKGETQVMQMDLAGFAISAGSACSSGKVRASRVLRAMGYDENDAASAIRISIGPSTAEAALADFVSGWSSACKRHSARAA